MFLDPIHRGSRSTGEPSWNCQSFCLGIYEGGWKGSSRSLVAKPKVKHISIQPPMRGGGMGVRSLSTKNNNRMKQYSSTIAGTIMGTFSQFSNLPFLGRRFRGSLPLSSSRDTLVISWNSCHLMKPLSSHETLVISSCHLMRLLSSHEAPVISWDPCHLMRLLSSGVTLVISWSSCHSKGKNNIYIYIYIYIYSMQYLGGGGRPYRRGPAQHWAK
jgi:hypothetical protein